MFFQVFLAYVAFLLSLNCHLPTKRYLKQCFDVKKGLLGYKEPLIGQCCNFLPKESCTLMDVIDNRGRFYHVVKRCFVSEKCYVTMLALFMNVISFKHFRILCNFHRSTLTINSLYIFNEIRFLPKHFQNSVQNIF